MITPTRGRYWSQHHGEWSLLDASQILETGGGLWGGREDELDKLFINERTNCIRVCKWGMF